MPFDAFHHVRMQTRALDSGLPCLDAAPPSWTEVNIPLAFIISRPVVFRYCGRQWTKAHQCLWWAPALSSTSYESIMSRKGQTLPENIPPSQYLLVNTARACFPGLRVCLISTSWFCHCSPETVYPQCFAHTAHLCPVRGTQTAQGHTPLPWVGQHWLPAARNI